MTEMVLALAADYGIPLLFVVTFLSCLALPVPSSLLMLACGGFAATGDLSLAGAALAAFAGAVSGDNAGYWLARHLGARMENWLRANRKRAALRAKAARYMRRRGGMAVFLSRWLAAPLGPYLNYISGLTGYAWPRFALWSAAGEVIWVGLYIGLGYVFASQITEIAALASDVSAFVAAGVVTLALGLWLLRAARAQQAANTGKPAETDHM